MNYVILITHGKFAEGLHDTLKMFVGDREDVLSIGLKQGEDVASLASRINELCESFNENDQFIVLGDMIGGSPLTTLMDCFGKHDLLKRSIVLGGVNLAMALNAVLMKEGSLEECKAAALREGMQAVNEVNLSSDDDDEI